MSMMIVSPAGLVGGPSVATPAYPFGPLPTIRPANMESAYVASWSEPTLSGIAYDSLATHAASMVSLHGDALFDAMEDHGTIAACDEMLRAAVIGDGVQLGPAITARPRDDDEEDDRGPGVDSDDPEMIALAQEAMAYCKRATEALPQDEPLEAMLWELQGGYGRGNAMAEVVWSETLEGGPDSGFRHLASVRVKPRSAWDFLIDETGRIAGFAVRGVRKRADRAPRRYLPRTKGVLLRNNPRPGRPQGKGDFQGVYAPWNELVLLRPEHWKYTATFASPFIWGTCAEGARDTTDKDGKTLSAVAAMARAMAELPRKKAGAGGFGSSAQILAPPGEGAAFSQFDAKCRMEIVERLLHQARAAARVAAGPDDKDSPQDDLTYIVRYRKTRLEQILRSDLYMPLVADRYGPELAQRITPWPRLGRVDIMYFSRFANALSRLVQVGAIPPALLPEMFDLLGMMGFMDPGDVRLLMRQQRAQVALVEAQVGQVESSTELARRQAEQPKPDPEPRPAP